MQNVNIMHAIGEKRLKHKYFSLLVCQAVALIARLISKQSFAEFLEMPVIVLKN